jgi:tyrosinase
MKVHEILQRTECGYTGRMPYWNEIADMDDMLADEMFTEQYFGGNGQGTDGCIADGPFVNLSLAFTPKTDNSCLYRNFSQTKLQQGVQANIDQCNAITNYTDAWPCWANMPHGAGHGGIGGIVSQPLGRT